MDNDNSGAIKPDENQSGIFSAGNLKLETEHLPTQFGGKVDTAGTPAHSQITNATPAAVPFPAYVTEDIKLTPSEKPKKKKWSIVIAFIIALASIVSVGGYNLFLKGYLNNKTEIANKFISYYKLIKDGTESAGSLPEDVWYIFALDAANLSDSEKESYLLNVKKAFDSFSDVADDKGSLQLKNELKYYKSLFHLISNFTNLFGLTQELQSNYLSGGALAASDYINQNVPYVPEESEEYNKISGYMQNSIREYLLNSVKLLEQYSKLGCIYEKQIDELCVGDYTEMNDIKTIRKSQNLANQYISAYGASAKENFIQYTDIIQKLVKEKDE